MARLNNTVRNGAVTMVFFVVSTLVAFFSRRVLLDHLGVDLLGLNTMLGSVIDIMLLMELGVTGAIGASLYKPLADGDRQRVNEIMWLIGRLYRLIAAGIVVVGLLVAPALPFMVEKSNVTLTQTYVAYGVFLLGTAATYLFGYGRVLFQADQRNHIPVIIVNSTLIAKVIVQVAVVRATGSYMWWLAIELLFQTSAYLLVRKSLYKRYELARRPRLSLRELYRSYRDIFVNARQLAVHQFAGFVLRQSDNIVIATMLSLSTVTMYGNYMLINNSLTGMLWNVLQNVWAGVGNLVATERREAVYRIYREYISANFFISIVVNLSLLFLIDDFIRIWLGPQYVLSHRIVLAFVGVNIMGSMTNASAAFLAAYRLFGYLSVPIAEAALNIVLSIVGAYYFGLVGVIAGTFASVMLSAVWKPIYLHREGFRLPLLPFALFAARLMGIMLAAVAGIWFGAVRPVRSLMGEVAGFGGWLAMAAMVFVSIVVIFGGLLWLLDGSFRSFVRRMVDFARKR